MRILHTALLLTTFTAACATDATTPPDQTVPLPPNHGLRTIYNMPGGSAAASLLYGAGTQFVFSGPTAPGTGTFTNAPYSEVDVLPGGTGSLHVTIDGVLYDVPATQTFGIGLRDNAGTPYLALGSYVEHDIGGATIVDEMLVIVPASDFAPGATVALDGDQRLALFGHGDISHDAPDVLAAAVTGSITFTSGTLAEGQPITASVSGDFGSVDFLPGPNPRDPGDPGDPGTPGTVTDGAYTLSIQATPDVYCDGDLAGQEAAFASVTAASLGFVDGAVTLTNTTSAGSPAVSIDGAPITSAFGVTPFDLLAQDALYVGFTNANAAGPAGTTFVGKYLVLDGGSATPTAVNAGAGAGYVDATGGRCSVSFGALLTGN